MKHTVIVAIAGVLALSACQKAGQNTYKASEIGVSRAVEFGTVLAVREVDIKGQNSGAGLLVGAGAGAGGGSYVGGGSGKSWATAGAALAGALIGHAIEQEMQNSTGYEYVLEMRTGDTKTIVQEKIEGDPVFKAGDKVMLQYCDAGDYQKKCGTGSDFQRLLPVDKFPSAGKKKHKK